MTGLQSPCRAQCMYRHCPSLVLQGKCCFLLVATGSGLSFLCRLEAMSSVSAAGSQQPARPSLAVQMEKRLSGSSQKIPKTGGNHPWDMGLCGLLQALLRIKGTLLAAPGMRKSESCVPHSWECFKARSDGALTSVLFVEGVPACGSKAGAR